jgi:hypothetical protein
MSGRDVNKAIPDTHKLARQQPSKTGGISSIPAKQPPFLGDPKNKLKRLSGRFSDSFSTLSNYTRNIAGHRKTVSETGWSGRDLAHEKDPFQSLKFSSMVNNRHSSPHPQRYHSKAIEEKTSPKSVQKKGHRDDSGSTNEWGCLADQLSAVLQNDTMNDRLFVPREALNQVITQATVAKELSRKVYLPAKISHRARLSTTPLRIKSSDYSTVDRTQAGNATIQTSFQQIFAVLLLIDRATKIWAFLREGVCDADLPLIMKPQQRRLKIAPALLRTNNPKAPLSCLKKRSDISSFVDQQWAVLVPVFVQSSTRSISHYTVVNKQSLPFIDWKFSGRGGRFGEIYEAKIHHSHHKFENDAVSRRRISSESAVKADIIRHLEMS